MKRETTPQVKQEEAREKFIFDSHPIGYTILITVPCKGII